MTEHEMFNQSFKRPKNYFKLSSEEQWYIDKKLGILDWKGIGISKMDRERFEKYYE